MTHKEYKAKFDELDAQYQSLIKLSEEERDSRYSEIKSLHDQMKALTKQFVNQQSQ